MRILVQAPSNIALVKYMGKRDADLNLPENPSLSMTLDQLCSYAELRWNPSLKPESLRFIPELPEGLSAHLCQKVESSEVGLKKIQTHFERCRAQGGEILQRHGVQVKREPKGFELRTANTFPAGTGIASSASSFAAMTVAFVASLAEDLGAFQKKFSEDFHLRKELSALSRQGSGSSCRSFFGPWVLWDDETAEPMEVGLPPLSDLVLVVSAHPKKVSSTQAHESVKTSSGWQKRQERLPRRILQFQKALEEGDWKKLSQLTLFESLEMHALFHSAEKPFRYWEQGTLEVLEWVMPLVTQLGESSQERPLLELARLTPLVTLDAGPNVHFIVPTELAEHWRKVLGERFPHFPILQDSQGQTGVKILDFEEDWASSPIRPQTDHQNTEKNLWTPSY